MAQEKTNRVQKSRRNKRRLNILLMALIGLVEFILLALIVSVSIGALPKDEPSYDPVSIYNAVAINIMLVWIGILVGYYTWAIYFYNINLGLTNEDWAEIREQKERGGNVVERDANPHKEQTLGLPEGTIRGTLALSLAIGAIAMLIASLDRENTWPANEIFIDAFDFFKTAFLMMIAFYFGNKSIESLKSSSPKPAAPPPPPTVTAPTLPPAGSDAPADLKKDLNDGDMAGETQPGDVAGSFDDPNAKG